jgi:hypothetical protein
MARRSKKSLAGSAAMLRYWRRRKAEEARAGSYNGRKASRLVAKKVRKPSRLAVKKALKTITLALAA